jgi:DNA polymerase-3 subunit epsilon
MNSFDWALKAFTEGAVFAAFDIETTGLDPRLDSIVEIGAVKFDRKGLIARFSTLINPGIPMPAEAGKVNNISDEMLKGKPSLDEVFPDFTLFIRGTLLAAHNAPFDCGFINEKLKNPLPTPIADTLVFSREVFPGRRSYSLQNLAADVGIPVMDAHRAEDDARLCMEIFLRCTAAMV